MYTNNHSLFPAGLQHSLKAVGSDLPATLSQYCRGYLIAVSSKQESLIDSAPNRMLSLPTEERPIDSGERITMPLSLWEGKTLGKILV